MSGDLWWVGCLEASCIYWAKPRQTSVTVDSVVVEIRNSDLRDMEQKSYQLNQRAQYRYIDGRIILKCVLKKDFGTLTGPEQALRCCEHDSSGSSQKKHLAPETQKYIAVR